MRTQFTVLLLLNILVCFGQQKQNLALEKHLMAESKIKTVLVIKRAGKPDTLLLGQAIIKAQDLISESNYSDEEALKKYGTRAVTIINLKPGIQLISLGKILDEYKILPDEMILPVYVNNVPYTSKAKDITTTTVDIKKVMISTDSLTNERYLDIRTDGLMQPKHQKTVIM